VKIAPTTVESRDVLRIEDYREKSCIPIHLTTPHERRSLYRDPDYPWDAYLQSERSGIRGGRNRCARMSLKTARRTSLNG